MEQRWIPVSERLPERDDKFYPMNLVTVRSGEIMLGVYRWDDKEWRTRPEAGGTYYTTESNVIAWMPLPEPYCEGEPKQTNADRIRSMTDEELAAFCCKVKADYQWADHEHPDEDACGDWEEWLRAESEE